MSSEGDAEDRGTMLAALEAHGQAFLRSFGPSAIPVHGVKRKRKESINSHTDNVDSSNPQQGDEDEWHGFGDDGPDHYQSMPSNDASKMDLPASGRPATDRPKTPVVVDFSHSRRPLSSAGQARSDKTFMSSKISKMKEDVSQRGDATAGQNEDDEQQLSDLRNDAELHRIIHTQLLSGSLDPMMDLKPSQKKKAMAGRVLEVAGKVKLGAGETDVRKEEHNKASKHIREGIRKKQKERAAQDLEEAKQLGNYHPTIKRLFAASSQPSAPNKRARGIGSGVGKFVGGTLKLSHAEIASVQGVPSKTKGRPGKNVRRR
ncbi:hypothetical protein DACRYDRAFT_24990 [Dacryopinax primogenitus]|uniref:Uncharacterized protein n=1 Tax=Dacryopinax primogenitus (strain DJM 731) TaxID=1858805 RepID=M5G1H8_DACPD|nr:uncharacterized protein DACRYDRAFT_24990 [Dacryopinax primogenitus]EJT97612.1 hypothetical protein DACRYDRAFT_24990 [Dacryopinax primogenitus]